MALDPDQSPLAEQLEALDELQVSVTLELIETELESEDKETLAEGLGAGPESDPDPPPPPPQETVKVNKKSKANILIFIQRLLSKFYTVKLLLIFLIARVLIGTKLLVFFKSRE